jgi:hypothetical protein
MLGLGVYRRWRDVRQADRELEVAKVYAKMMGAYAVQVAGPFCLEAVFRVAEGPGLCRNEITRAQFIWHGKCTECAEKEKALAKRR